MSIAAKIEVPQRLKPIPRPSWNGTPEGVPLQSNGLVLRRLVSPDPLVT